MLVHRRIVLALCTIGFAPLASVAQQKPGDYPNKPIRIVIGIAAGGGLDMATRLGAQKLSDKWGQPVVVDNRPGAGSLVAADLVERAVPDGYTLLGASDTLMLIGVLKRTTYDVRTAFVPIVNLAGQPYMLVVTPSLPVKSVPELIAYAKAKPGVLSYGSQGLGSNGHIGMERFKLMTGVNMVHVPYKGASVALIDVISGQIQLMFASTISTSPYIRGGKLRALGATSLKRVPAFPDVPTISESGVPGFEVGNHYSYFAPAGTPRPIIRAIALVVGQGMNSPETANLLAADGSQVAAPSTPGQFKEQFAKDYADLQRVIEESNIKFN